MTETIIEAISHDGLPLGLIITLAIGVIASIVVAIWIFRR